MTPWLKTTDAEEVDYTPGGDLAADDVAEALDELDTEVGGKIGLFGNAPSNNALMRAHSTGDEIQGSTVILSDAGNMTGLTGLTVAGNILTSGTVDGRDIAGILDNSTIQNALVKYSDTSGSQTSQNKATLTGAELELAHPSPGSISDHGILRLTYSGEPDDLQDGTPDKFAELIFSADDSTGTQTDYGRITSSALLTFNTLEYGRVSLEALNAGTMDTIVEVDGGGYIDIHGTQGQLVSIHGYLDFPDGAEALMVRANRAAFVYREDKDAGLFFSAGFEFRDLSGSAIFNIRTSTGNTEWSDGGNLVFGTGTGTKIGTATTQKIGFYNATPVDQPATVSDPTDLASCITSISAVIDRLQELGLIA